jgi:subtilisin family serine protease
VDPKLLELTEGAADEEVEAIIRLHQPHLVPPGVRIIAQFGTIATCRLRRGLITDVRRDERVASMKAPLLVVSDDEPVLPAEAKDFYEPSSESDYRRPRVEHATGRGVVVGVIDWGCDFTHPNFRHADGRTRLLALWDQAAPYSADRPNRYSYGVIHSADDINRALDSDRPDAALGYSWHRSDPTGTGAHGTHVLDIAAGNGRVGGPVGVAPEANLVFVHLVSRGLPERANLGSSVSLLEAVDFIFRVAGDRPVCVNISMGRQMGPHDGSTLVELAFDAVLNLGPGRAIVESTGNYYDRAVHTSGQLLPGQVAVIPFQVSEADVTPNELEGWYPGRDVMAVAVRSPSGVLSKKTGLDDQATIRVGDREVCRIYHRARDPNNLDNNIHVFMYTTAPPGTWEFILTGEDIVDGRFHVWIERDATCEHCQARFDPRYAIPQMTTNTICNGTRTIAVGAYNAHDSERRLGIFSSSGPTRDGRVKPDLIAPGVRVLAARSAPGESNARYNYLTRKSGTSMAAPHVTGAVALMFEVAGRPLYIHETRNLLLTSARPADVTGDEVHRIGSGYLDMDMAIGNTRRYVQSTPPTTIEQEQLIMAHIPLGREHAGEHEEVG